MTNPDGRLQHPRQGGFRLSPPLIFLVTFLLWTTFFWGLILVTGGMTVDWPVAVGIASGGLVLATRMTILSVRERTRFGGPDTAASVTRAIRTGQLPPQPTRPTWALVLEYRYRQAGWMRWVAPLVCGIATALALWLALTDGKWMPIGWVYATILPVIGIAAWVQAQRVRPRIRRLQEALNAGPSDQP